MTKRDLKIALLRRKSFLSEIYKYEHFQIKKKQKKYPSQEFLFRVKINSPYI